MPFQRGKRPDLARSAGCYTSCPVVKQDLALLEVWLRTPEVIRWWANRKSRPQC
jgi:hypothetical protein